MKAQTDCTCAHHPALKSQKRGPVKWQRGGGGGGAGVRDVNHKPATSAGKWMALICISSCMIHQHHFTTVQNITFILQMLIYDKQLIWETSDLRSIKDPLTFIFFCLKKRSVFVWAGASVHAHSHPVPLGFHLSVCRVCVSACVCQAAFRPSFSEAGQRHWAVRWSDSHLGPTVCHWKCVVCCIRVCVRSPCD